MIRQQIGFVSLQIFNLLGCNCHVDSDGGDSLESDFRAGASKLIHAGKIGCGIAVGCEMEQ